MKTSRKGSAGTRSKPVKPSPNEQAHAAGKWGPQGNAASPEANMLASLRELTDVGAPAIAAEKPTADLSVKDSPTSESPSTVDGSAPLAPAPDTSATATVSKTDDDAHMTTAVEEGVVASQHRPNHAIAPTAARQPAHEASPAPSSSPAAATAAADDDGRDASPPADAAPANLSGPAAEASPTGRSRRARKVPAKLADAAVTGVSGRAAPRQPAKRPRDDVPATEPPDASTATVAHVGEHTPSSQNTVAGPPVGKRARKGAPRRAAE